MTTPTSAQPESVAAALDEAEALRGGRAAFAKELQVSSAAIGNWKKRGVPVKSAVRIEELTDRQVLRQHLRPADYLEIWPELGDGRRQAGAPAGAAAANTSKALPAAAHEGAQGA